MAATFGSPVSAVLLAVELLLFEFRPRSIVPVALASATATAVRMAYAGVEPIFKMPHLALPSGEALAVYTALGAVIGWLAVYVTRAVYWIEDLFEEVQSPPSVCPVVRKEISIGGSCHAASMPGSMDRRPCGVHRLTGSLTSRPRCYA